MNTLNDLRNGVSRIYYVYFLTDGDNMKIGITQNLDFRLKQLQTANAKKLSFYDAYRCDSKETAEMIEKQLHKQFKEYHMNGEWFQAEPIIEWCKQAYVNEIFHIGDVLIEPDYELISLMEREI